MFFIQSGGTWTSVHQSSINGKYDNFSKNDLLEFAKTFGIKKANIILQEVIEAVSKWNKLATELEIPYERIKYIQEHLRINNFN